MTQATKSRPDLSRFSQGVPHSLLGSAWHRWEELSWLGPYTPDWIPDYIRKRMRRDPQIQLGLTALKSPFYGTTYWASGGNARTRAFVQKTLIEAPWFKSLIGSILNALDFGRQTHELMWNISDVTIDTDGEGPIPPIELPRAYVLGKPIDQDPELATIWVDGDTGDFCGFSSPRTLGRVVPASKAIHAAYRPEWQNWLGTAIIDASYNAWYWANQVYVFVKRHLELKGDPPLKGRAPSQAPHKSDKTLDGQNPSDPVRELGLIAAALRGSGVCVLPSDRDPQTKELLYDLEEMVYDTRDEQFLRMLQHYNDLKLRALLVPERIVTQESTVGSFAMQQGMLDVFFSNLQVILEDLILSTLNEQVVRPLVELNFGKSAPMPCITASPISKQNNKLLAELIKASLTVPRHTKDGREFLGAELIDLATSLKTLGVPSNRADDIARDGDGSSSASLAERAAKAAMAQAQTIAPTPEEIAVHQDSASSISSLYGVGPGMIRGWVGMGCPSIRVGNMLRFNRAKVEEWRAAQEAARLQRKQVV